jgi:hypothetical protein
MRAGYVLAAVMLAFLTQATVLAAEQSVDLAQGKPATASSAESTDHAASMANDGKADTRWCAETSGVPQWWQVDLLRPCDLTGAKLTWEMDGRNYQYIIEGSTDGAAWQTLSDQSESTATSKTQAPHFTANGIRYVRIRITGLEDGSWASLFDVQVLGTGPKVADGPVAASLTETPLVVSSGPRPARVFSHPDRIRYDGQCLTIDGKDILIYSGAFHYFRCPKELWPDRFRKIKEAHFNAVETYVPWNFCEQSAPSNFDDESKIELADLHDWLQMAHEQFHLYTIVRPGPYICAEWAGGGFPRWLLSKQPTAGTWLRSDEPQYLSWCKHWYSAVCKVVAPEQITRKPIGSAGVILFQIENEYDYCNSVTRGVKINQLRALYTDAITGGIDVPIFTCWTRQVRGSSDPMLSQPFDAINEYPRHDLARVSQDIALSQREQPDAPVMISELQGGWFSRVGGKLSEDQPDIEPEQTHALTLASIRDGATILNYYMLCGGTNFGGWGARELTTTYDYDAPIREWGGVGEKYRVVQAIGELVQAWGPEIARGRCVAQQHEPNGVTLVVRQSSGGASFIFASRDIGSSGVKGTASIKMDGSPLKIDYDLTETTFQVARLAAGTPTRWLPRVIPAGDPPAVPAAVTIDRLRIHADGGPVDAKPIVTGQTLLSNGEELRWIYYVARPVLSAEQAGGLSTLDLELFASDTASVSVNGSIVPCKSNRRHALQARVAGALKEGENEIIVLYDDQGIPNGGNDMQTPPGLKSGKLGSTSSSHGVSAMNLTWQLADHLAGLAARWEQPSLDTSDWKEIRLGSTDPHASSDALATWYRAEFTLPAADLHVWVPWKATVDISGDAWIYVNGHAVGRYWDVGPQHDFYLPECWLKFGPGKTNSLAIVVRPTRSSAALRKIEVAPYKDFAESR